MRDSRWRDAKSKSFSPLNFSYFESALVFYSALFLSYPIYIHPVLALSLFVSRLLESHNCSYPSESRILASHICSYPFASRLLTSRIYSYPFASRLPASRICPYPFVSVYSHPVSAPALLFRFILYKNPVKCLNRSSLLRL